MKNMDLFNQYSAEIFSMLYLAFPEPIGLDALSISGHQEIDENGSPEKEAKICKATIQWLADTGYLSFQDEYQYGAGDAVLTAKGLEVLKAVPGSLKNGGSIGDKIVTTLKGGAKETATALVKTALTEGFKLLMK